MFHFNEHSAAITKLKMQDFSETTSVAVKQIIVLSKYVFWQHKMANKVHVYNLKLFACHV